MLPKLTNDQRRANAEKANRVRRARGKMRERLKRGEMGIAEVFKLTDAGDQIAGRMYVSQLISSMPGYAFAKTRDLMHELGIASCKRVKGLGIRQREALLKIFGKEQA